MRGLPSPVCRDIWLGAGRGRRCLPAPDLRHNPGKRSSTADTALPPERCSVRAAQFWLNLQSRFDLLKAEDESISRQDKQPGPHAAWMELQTTIESTI